MMYNTWVLLRSQKKFYFYHAERCYGNLANFFAIFEVRFRFYIKFRSYSKFQNFEIPSKNFEDFALVIRDFWDGFGITRDIIQVIDSKHKENILKSQNLYDEIRKFVDSSEEKDRKRKRDESSDDDPGEIPPAKKKQTKETCRPIDIIVK